jgi:NAD(P)-dependent dehydrogenase (short-subunit alcohol dehydrogenase family)
MNLEGTAALVTGAGKRVGRTLALRLAELGCDVAVHYNNSYADANEVAEEIRRLERRPALIQGDLSNVEQARRVALEASDAFPDLAILVNSAANFPRTELENIQPKDWEEALDTNLLGPFWLAQALGPLFVGRGSGKIINIADISWRSPWPSRLPYCVSKAGLVSLTLGLAKAYAPQVQVNAIGPGPILFPEDYSQEERDKVISKTLLKRQGHPGDIADAVEFLCRCDYVTGHFLPVDGGQSLPGS